MSIIRKELLNDVLDLSLSDMVPEIKNVNFSVGFGGPVNPDNLFYIHDLGEKIEDSKLITSGLWTGGNFDQIISFSIRKSYSDGHQ